MLALCRSSLVFALIVNLSFIPAAAASAPTEEVKAVVNEVIRILKDPALKAPAQKARRRQMLKATVDRRFDYEEMAKRSLGGSWNTLSAAQRREFVQVFGELLEASYAEKIEKYSDETVNYTGETLEGNFAEVRTQIVRKNDRIPINYRLLNKNPWMVYDVIIEGVSLVNNYRNQFGRVLQTSSYNDLINRLKTKVDEQRKLEKM
jgi:phospholipid transport system substrate-binding protein